MAQRMPIAIGGDIKCAFFISKVCQWSAVVTYLIMYLAHHWWHKMFQWLDIKYSVLISDYTKDASSHQ